MLINPEIVALGSEMRVHEEGCLSIPDVRIDIERPSSLTVRFLDRDGKPQELGAEGLLATAIQHEIDHLNGKLIIDFLSRLKRDIIVRKFKKLAKSETAQGSAGVGLGRWGPARALGRLQKQVGGRGSRPEASRCMRVVFMGTPDFAVPTLGGNSGSRAPGRRRLYPAAAAGRARHGRAQARGSRFAEGAGLPVLTPAVLKGEAEQAAVRRPGADVAVVVAYGLILPGRRAAGAARTAASTCTPPPCRAGAAPRRSSARSWLGSRTPRRCVMRMDEGLDTGPVCLA